ncbi:MAG: ATP-binding protein [Candidatus Omnitrophota bacterium]
MMMAVIVPGLILSALGFFYVSKQGKARELDFHEKYRTILIQIRDETERQIQAAVEHTFKQMATLMALHTIDHPDALQNLMKNMLLENPVVEYPFLIDSNGRYIFPFTRKAPFVKGTPITRDGILFTRFGRDAGKYRAFSSLVYSLVKRAEDFEFKERKYEQAIRYYRQALANINGNNPGTYIYHVDHAIARCYYKLNKFPQAAAYLTDILLRPPDALIRDTVFYSMTLYLAARVYRQLDIDDKAVASYLRLYDQTLGVADAPAVDNGMFVAFKNEALAYLLRHRKKNDANADAPRPDRVKAREDLEKLSELDIDLRWNFVDVADETGMEKNEKGEGPSTFRQLWEFYLPTDAKTLFYKQVKERNLGNRTGAIPWNDRPDIVYTRIAGTGPNPATAPQRIFGFRLSFAFIASRILPPIVKKHLADTRMMVTLKPNKPSGPADSQNSSKTFVLIRLPFKRFFAGTDLVLSGPENGYIRSLVKKEMGFDYSLIATIIALLLVGGWFFYKYTAREAELVRLKSEFVDSASHTLKTPLTRIRMMAEKMELGWINDESKKKEYFRAILSETDRMTDMVTNMLDFSRIEAGRMRFDMKKGCIAESVRDTLNALHPHIQSLGFTLQIELVDDMPLGGFDPQALKSILVNLVDNALKYAKAEKTITVRLYLAENQRAVLEVEDRGMGIPARDVERIFEKFYRGRDETVKAMEGSGLGLFLVRHAVKAHKGDIDVISEPGKGSTFRVYLPLDSRNA